MMRWNIYENEAFPSLSLSLSLKCSKCNLFQIKVILNFGSIKVLMQDISKRKRDWKMYVFVISEQKQMQLV